MAPLVGAPGGTNRGNVSRKPESWHESGVTCHGKVRSGTKSVAPLHGAAPASGRLAGTPLPRLLRYGQ